MELLIDVTNYSHFCLRYTVLSLHQPEEGQLGARSSVKNSCAIAGHHTGGSCLFCYTICKTTKDLEEIAERDASISKD